MSPRLPRSVPAARLPDTEAVLKQKLRTRLLALSFHAFEHCIRELLVKMGYRGARTLGRTGRRGRTRHGGRDLEAVAETGVTRTLVIVQAKQYRRPVSRRFVDELRGTMLRVGARQGVLVTTSRFSRAARSAAWGSAILPVRLVEGEELLDLLVSQRLGVRAGMGGSCEFDNTYFRQLADRYPEPAPPSASAAHPEKPRSPSGEGRKSNNTNPPTDEKGSPMMYRTHCLLAVNMLWLLAPFPSVLNSADVGLMAAAAAFGALLPDLDAEESRIHSLAILGIRPFAPLSLLLYRAWGHRGPLHSLLGLATFVLLVVPLSLLWGWPLSLALVMGYASHLLGDAATRTGIPLLFPRRQRYFLLPRKLRLVTGSMAEEVLLVILAMAALPLFLFYLSQLLTQPL